MVGIFVVETQESRNGNLPIADWTVTKSQNRVFGMSDVVIFQNMWVEISAKSVGSICHRQNLDGQGLLKRIQVHLRV